MAKRISILVFLLTAMIARSESIKNTDAEKIGTLFKNEYKGNGLICITEPLQCISTYTNVRYDYDRNGYFDHNGYFHILEVTSEDLEQINKLLESWKRKAEGTFKPTKSKILVVGNSGVGISTFVQFMAGNNSKLISEEAGIGNEEFIIKDDEKIGTTLKESYTIYPEEFILNENTTICDIPGFSDSRNLTEEILVSYNKEKYFKNFNEYSNTKIVIITEYYSVQNGIFKRNFINLLENIYNHYYHLIHKRYYNNKLNYINLKMIAVKVPNKYKAGNSIKQIIPDKTVIINIANYIKKFKLFLTENLKQQIRCDEHKFFNFAITLIESLLDEDMDGNYRKINIFRQPEEPGNLNEMKLFQDNKISLMQTILHDTDDKQYDSYYRRIDDSNTPNKLKQLSQKFEEFKTCIKQTVSISMETTLNQLKALMPKYNVSQENPYDNPYDKTYTEMIMLNNAMNNLYKLKYHFN